MPRHFGCSVSGPANVALGRACQDAWAGRSWRVHGSLATSAIAVADGLGSRPKSRTGARAAVSVALVGARRWSDNPALGTSWLVRWIEAEWRFAIGPEAPEDCCTTCLLAVHSPERGLLIGGIGDGLGLISTGQGIDSALPRRNAEAFSNETLALGSPHRASDWAFETIPTPTGQWTIILATDGVSDDLKEDKLDHFVCWVNEVGGLRRPGASLRRALQNWPTAQHLDDKTIAVLKSNPKTYG